MPVVSIVVVVSLAIGIGVNTVVFSWMQARLLNPVPGVDDGRDLLLIEPRTEAGLYPGASWPEFKDLQTMLGGFDEVIAARMAPLYVGPAGGVERIFGLLVSSNYFSALGVRPAAGRFFAADEVMHAGGAPVVVISHRLWTSQLHGATDVVGRTIRINGRELTVIGVAPDEFQGTVVGLQFDAYLPATLAPVVSPGSTELDNRSVRGYQLIGRLEPSVSPAQAQEEVATSMRQLAGTYPDSNGKVSGEVLRFTDSPRGPQRMLNAALATLQAIMLLLLLAVCGNVANLMLARASARQKEMGIRLALGAQPWRVASLLLTENIVLAVLGGALGAAFAVWGSQALLVLPLTGLPLRFQTTIDGVGLGFAIVLGVACGALAGAAPAVQLSRIDPQRSFRAGVASGGRSGLRHGLMGAQVALAMIVLLVAGLFLRSLVEARDADPGFRREGVLLAAYDLAGRSSDAAANRDLAARTLDAIGRLPSVQSVAIAGSVPLDIHGMPSRSFTVDGHSRADGRSDEALSNIVTPGYFALMGITQLTGRDFAPLTDTSAPPQAIVNEEFVRRYVADGEPLGRQVRARGGRFTIIGLVRNSLSDAFGEPPTPVIYFSYRDNPQPRGEIHVRLRNGSESHAAAEVRRVMRELEPDLPVFNLRSLTDHVATNLIFRTVPARMFSVLGPLLLVLAGIGIYAVVAYSVSLRTREVGVRVALGATSGRVVGQFVGESMSVVAIGGLLGWSVAFLLASQVVPGGEVDAAVFTVVPAILLAVAAIASWIPAQRTVAIDPSAALRAE